MGVVGIAWGTRWGEEIDMGQIAAQLWVSVEVSPAPHYRIYALTLLIT